MILLAHNSLWRSVLSWIIEIWSLLVVRAHHPQGDSACWGSGQNGTLSLLVLLVISSGRRCRYCTGTVMYPLAM